MVCVGPGRKPRSFLASWLISTTNTAMFLYAQNKKLKASMNSLRSQSFIFMVPVCLNGRNVCKVMALEVHVLRQKNRRAVFSE